MLVLSALVLASEFGGWGPPAPTAWSALRSGKGARGTMRSVFFGGPPPRARTEPRGERGADVLENGRNGDVRAPRRQCSAQI